MLTGNRHHQPRALMPERARRVIRGSHPRGRKEGAKQGRWDGGGIVRERIRPQVVEAKREKKREGVGLQE